jgi:1,4-dihydroxy-2-naphthoyl-CoA hydrolase
MDMDIAIPHTLDQWNAAGAEYLPGHLGIEFVRVEPQEVVARLTVQKALMAWNGFLHAGAVVSLADTCCGYGTVRSLPAGASGFTTIELKSNFLGSAREGIIQCTARPCTRAAPRRSGTRWWCLTARQSRLPSSAARNDPVAEGVNGCGRWGQTPRMAG